MRGGARIGAGRPGWKQKEEGLFSVDLRLLPVPEMMCSGARYSYHWDNRWFDAGVIVQVLYSDTMALQYAEGVRSVAKNISLAKTNCNFGGSRYWFFCPACGCRAVKIYLSEGEWWCRNCLTLSYASQSMDVLSRLHHRISKLINMMAEDGEKPCGMHWKTYDKIADKINDTEKCFGVLFKLEKY